MLDGLQSKIVVDPAIAQYGLRRKGWTIEIGALGRLHWLLYRQRHRRQYRRERGEGRNRGTQFDIRRVNQADAIVAHIRTGKAPQCRRLNVGRVDDETWRGLAGIVRK